jgi:hypothetical protein
MHARDLIELAAIVAANAPVLITGREPIPPESVEAYWTASKSRLDRWGIMLKSLTRETSAARPPAAACAAPSACSPRPLVRGLVEEILTGEVLTRVWAAITCAYDRRRKSDVVEPIVRSVLLGHLEARYRVLTLLAGQLNASGVDAEEALKLNCIRLRTERWTDVLLSRLAPWCDIRQFAIEPERANDFAEDLSRQRQREGGRFIWPLLQASRRAAFQHGLSPESPNPDLNSKIAGSIIGCFPGDVFDGTGLITSAWMARISRITGDAAGMLDELIHPPAAGAVSHTSLSQPRHRFDGRRL